MKLNDGYFLTEYGRIHYYEIGKGPPLLFIHGFGGSGLSFKKAFFLLANNHYILAPSLLGCGRSDKIPFKEWDVFKWAQSLLKLIYAKDLKNITLIGHSLGGAVALALIKEDPKLFKKLILINSLGIKVKRTFAKWLLFWFLKNLQRFVTHPLNLGPYLLSLLFNIRNHPSDLNIMIKIARQVHFENLDFVKIPTIIFWGSQDFYVSQRIGIELNRRIKNSRMIFVKGGHDWPILNPEKLLSYLED